MGSFPPSRCPRQIKLIIIVIVGFDDALSAEELNEHCNLCLQCLQHQGYAEKRMVELIILIELNFFSYAILLVPDSATLA